MNRTAVESLTVWTFAADPAMVMSYVTRYKDNGSILETGCFCYIVIRDAEGWKIVTFLAVMPPFSRPWRSAALVQLTPSAVEEMVCVSVHDQWE